MPWLSHPDPERTRAAQGQRRQDPAESLSTLRCARVRVRQRGRMRLPPSAPGRGRSQRQPLSGPAWGPRARRSLRPRPWPHRSPGPATGRHSSTIRHRGWRGPDRSPGGTGCRCDPPRRAFAWRSGVRAPARFPPWPRGRHRCQELARSRSRHRLCPAPRGCASRGCRRSRGGGWPGGRHRRRGTRGGRCRGSGRRCGGGSRTAA